jgi:hypothetical protein
MARNQKNRARETTDEGVHEATEEVGNRSADILTFSMRAAEQSANRFSSMFGLGQDPGEAVQQSAHSVQVLQSWAGVLGVGYRDISREYMNWLQSQLQTNFKSVSSLMQCRTVEQFIAVQNQLLGENIALALSLNRRVAEISKEMADRAAGKIAEVAKDSQRAANQAA